MINAYIKTALLAASLGLALVPAAAPTALADSPGYLFLNFEQQPAASSNSKATPTPTAGNDNADAAKGHATPPTSPDRTSTVASDHADRAQGHRAGRAN
jgi:hypothetical protein